MFYNNTSKTIILPINHAKFSLLPFTSHRNTKRRQNLSEMSKTARGHFECYINLVVITESVDKIFH